MANSADQCIAEYEELGKEYEQLQEIHKEYSKKVDEVRAIQRKCMSHIAHQRYRMRQIGDSARRATPLSDSEEKGDLKTLSKNMDERKSHFRELEEVLPHENGVYLKIILGSVNVSLLSKQDKYQYKEDYERFKFYLSMIILLYALLLYFINTRVIDAAFQFLLVWYYCTLTIREHILKVNGSRIKGWWITHHFISTACGGIFLVWPDGYTYHAFRPQFVGFAVYLSLVQLLQYYYQSGSLYRLRALGERRNMDITVEGFQSWMWKGLTFLLPFLVGGYIFQLYNAYVLYGLSRHVSCIEWQVYALAIIFLILFLGNMITTIAVIRHKILVKGWAKEFMLRNKYRFSKPFNSSQ